jgi:hypothetical protein
MPHNEAVRLLDSTHPIFKGLGWRQKPRGRTKQVVELLCTRPDPNSVRFTSDLDLDGLPSNAAIAEQLGVSEKTVKDHIAKAATNINGLAMLRARARIYVCHHHELWKDQWSSTTTAVSNRGAPPTGTSRVA